MNAGTPPIQGASTNRARHYATLVSAGLATGAALAALRVLAVALIDGGHTVVVRVLDGAMLLATGLLMGIVFRRARGAVVLAGDTPIISVLVWLALSWPLGHWLAVDQAAQWNRALGFDLWGSIVGVSPLLPWIAISDLFGFIWLVLMFVAVWLAVQTALPQQTERAADDP